MKEVTYINHSQRLNPDEIHCLDRMREEKPVFMTTNIRFHNNERLLSDLDLLMA